MKCPRCGSTMVEGGCFREIYYSCPRCGKDNEEDEDTLELAPWGEIQFEYVYTKLYPWDDARKYLKAMVKTRSSLRLPRVCPPSPYVTLRVPIQSVIAYDRDVAIIDTAAPFEILNPNKGTGLGTWEYL